MGKRIKENIKFREPSITDGEMVLDLRSEFYTTNCKFNGTSSLDIFPSYVEWLANVYNNARSTNFKNSTSANKYTYLAIREEDNRLIGMAEITYYFKPNDNMAYAHVVECIRPSERRKGYSELVIKKSTEQCRSAGVRKDKLTYERNSKASSITMNNVANF